MSHRVEHLIWCDHVNSAGARCDRERGAPIATFTATELRRYLRTRGWRRTRDGRDLCPDHANPKEATR